MTTAIVESRVKLTSVDRSSKNINKSNRALKNTARSLDRAAKKSTEMGNALRSATSGNVIGAVQGLAGALGPGAGVAGMAVIATGAVAALGAGVAVAAVKFTKWSIEIERLRAGLDAAFGGEGLQRAISLAEQIGGVGAENVGKLASTIRLTGIEATFTSEQLQELTARATAVGKSGDEALQALNKALTTGTTRSLKMVGTFIESSRVQDEYAKAIGKTTTQLTAFDKQQAVANALMEDLNRATGAVSETFSKQDRALANLDNAWLSLKGTISETAAEDMALVVQKTADLIRWTERWIDVLAEAAKIVELPFVALKRIGEAVVNSITAALEGRFVDAATHAGEAIGRGIIGPLGVVIEQINRMGDAAVDTALRTEQAAINAIRGVQGGLQLREGGRFAGKIQSIEENFRKREKALKKKRIKPAAGPSPAVLALQAEQRAADALFDSFEKLQAVKAQVASADLAEQDRAIARAKGFSQAIMRAREDEILAAQAAKAANIDAAFSTAEAVVQASGAMDAAVIALSATRTTFALGVGLLAVAEKGLILGGAQLAAGISAAAQFAATARSSPPSVGSAGGGGLPSSPGQSVASAQPAQQPAGPTVINIFGVANTRAELGHAWAKNVAAAKGTGMVPA